MRVTVSLDGALARYAGALGRLPPQVQRAAVQGLNEGGDLTRTQVRRDLRDQTGVKAYSSITGRTATKRAHLGHLVYTIEGTGKGMPIKEFPVRASVGAPVTAQPWRVGHTFSRSFKTSRQGLLRARRGASRMPIRALFGPAVSKEIVQDETAAHFQAQAGPRVEGAVMRRLGRLLP